MYRNLRIVLTLLVLCWGSLFLVQRWQVYRNVPANFEWNAVQDHLAANASADDLLLFEPAWLAGYAQDFGRMRQFSEVSRRDLKEKAFPPSSELWLISIFPENSAKADLKKMGFVEEALQAVYSVLLTRFRIPQKNFRYDFTANLAAAEAFAEYGNQKIDRGEWKNGQWVFSDPPDEWNQIRVATQPFRGQMRRCLWFHPLANAVKTLSFSSVPLGNTLYLYGGIVDSGIGTPPRAPVHFGVLIDGKTAAFFEYRDTDIRFARRIDTSAFSGVEHRVEFQVQTPDPFARHFCFSAWAVEE